MQGTTHKIKSWFGIITLKKTEWWWSKENLHNHKSPDGCDYYLINKKNKVTQIPEEAYNALYRLNLQVKVQHAIIFISIACLIILLIK